MKKQILSIFTILSVSAGIAQTIPNNGFESWASQFSAPTEPTNYVTENVFASPFVSSSNPTSVTQATGADACAGTYAAKITTVHITTNPSGGAIPNDVGVAILGGITLIPSFALKPGKPWNTRLYSVDFCYKYTPVGADNGAVVGFLTKWNGVSRDTIASAYFPLTTTVSAYTQGSASFVYSGSFPGTTLPDTLHCYFLSSANPWVPTVTATPEIGSALWIDAATAVGIKGSTKIFGNDVKSYPNPATSFVMISATSEQAVSVDVFDITGKKIAGGMFDDKKARIETAELSEGLYLYSVKDKNNKVIATGKVNVSK
ncbi:MAG: Secretion system C-terminal sorting domain [Bacteroidetes bacterium]|jgi:hypothetical protein|nr:Secretion system C-terminal sorting domain [Bacteroidota bacterium]